MKLRRFWHRLIDRDRLAYAMVIAFGVSLLGIMLFFTFGYQLGEMRVTVPPFIEIQGAGQTKMLLIDEPRPIVRAIEIFLALGLIVLGIERFRNHERRSGK